MSKILQKELKTDIQIIYQNTVCCIEYFSISRLINNRLAYVFSSGGNRNLSGNHFGENFLIENGFDVVSFKVNNDDWFQNIPEYIFKEIEKLVVTKNYCERVALGASMGGYAAIAFSSRLFTDKVLA